jgi:hypothetical protein
MLGVHKIRIDKETMEKSALEVDEICIDKGAMRLWATS